jgi:hypothetical protein
MVGRPADWLGQLHALLDKYEGTVDIAFVRLIAWCALLLGACCGWARLWSDSLHR